MDRILGLTHTQFSQLTFLVYLVVIAPAMLVGFYFARRKLFKPYHKFTMTAVVVANWVFIVFHMLLSYAAFVAPASAGGPLGNPIGRPGNLIPTIHLVTGGIAQVVGTYLVVLMWTEKTRFAWILPKPLQTRNIKPYMRLTLALWLVTAALGAVIFFTWYPPSAAAPSTTAPAATEQATEAAAEEGGATMTQEPGATEEPAATQES